ncbi:MAG: hypothetical protein ACRD8W_30205 [Nitrososphaeraceae archaeon]
MIDQVIVYIIMIIFLAAIMFQQQLTVASPKDATDNQSAKSQTVIPESPVNGNTTEASSEPASIPEEPSNDDVFHCAALGCPGNPPNPHGPPTEEPEGDK